MMRLAIAFCLVLAACSGKSKNGSTTGSGSGSGSGSSTTILAKKIVVSFGITPGTNQADVFLQTTDETGHQVSNAVGTYKGTCNLSTPAPEMKALVAVQCKDGATGWELQAVAQGAAIVVLKMRIDDGVAPDPMAREEVTRVAVPTGAAIEAG